VLESLDKPIGAPGGKAAIILAEFGDHPPAPTPL